MGDGRTGNHMRQLVSAACGLWTAFALAAAAQTAPGASDETASPVLVELFTSQGCSSCPPADAVFAGLAQDPRVIALALHVDYWDYLGWEDRFARPEFTKRQKAYAKMAGAKMVYTPQVIVGGQEAMIGHKAGLIEEAVRRQAAAARAYDIRLTVTREGDRFVIRAEAVPPTDRRFRVQFVRFRPQEEVAIERGENAGQVVTYHNIVTSWDPVADWTATTPFSATLPATGSDPAVAIVQEEGPGAVAAAAILR